MENRMCIKLWKDGLCCRNPNHNEHRDSSLQSGQSGEASDPELSPAPDEDQVPTDAEMMVPGIARETRACEGGKAMALVYTTVRSQPAAAHAELQLEDARKQAQFFEIPWIASENLCLLAAMAEHQSFPGVTNVFKHGSQAMDLTTWSVKWQHISKLFWYIAPMRFRNFIECSGQFTLLLAVHNAMKRWEMGEGRMVRFWSYSRAVQADQSSKCAPVTKPECEELYGVDESVSEVVEFFLQNSP